jgi:hypothetical protein
MRKRKPPPQPHKRTSEVLPPPRDDGRPMYASAPLKPSVEAPWIADGGWSGKR